jgi:endonuclease/exonuclease/phosphatase family metal-dependent hydrolase
VYGPIVALNVLSWNLFHGRAVPPAGRDLLAEFATVLAGWEWDVALLQEVPPWWAPELAVAAGAETRWALTSRNALPAVRRAVAVRWPDAIKSGGGGANAILVRGEIVEHRVRRLRRWPERRVVHGVHTSAGPWIVNFHATVHHAERAREDIALARTIALAWAGDAPLVLGGDFNVREPDAPGFQHAAGHDVDHVFSRGLQAAAPGRPLAHGVLSDHAPVLATLMAERQMAPRA